MTNQLAPAMAELRLATRNFHNRLQALPFFTALEQGQLPIESYLGQLRAMTLIHGILETQLAQSSHPAFASVWTDAMCKLPLLDRDLAYFESRLIPDIPQAVDQALEIARRLRLRSAQDPVSLLGYLYVFEGATLGGSVLRFQIADNFNLRGSIGTAYLSSYQSGLEAQWQRFSHRMDRTLVDAAERARTIDAAQEAFRGLGQLFQALYPFAKESLKYLAITINPEAGTHPIPGDMHELKGALRAGDIAWREFPYLAWRYGDRGKRFIRSDSAWLATLCQHNTTRMQQQIDWLGRLLAARGIPQLLLARHLEILHTELIRAVPENQPYYNKLLQIARTMHEARHRIIDDERLQRLAREFETDVSPDWARRLYGIGTLLVAAVADEKAGIDNAVPSLVSWLTEPTRFPQSWIRTVEQTVTKTYKQIL